MNLHVTISIPGQLSDDFDTGPYAGDTVEKPLAPGKKLRPDITDATLFW